MATTGRFSTLNNWSKDDPESMEQHILYLDGDYRRLKERHKIMIKAEQDGFELLHRKWMRVPGFIRFWIL